MKIFNYYLSFFLLFISLNGFSQNSEVIFVNNHPHADAASLDLKVVEPNTGTEHGNYPLLNYIGTTNSISLPSSTILEYQYYEAGTNNLFYTKSNVVLTDGSNYVSIITGNPSSSSVSYGSSTISASASNSTKVRYGMRNSTYDLGDIDVIIRETGEKLTDNLEYPFADFASQFDVPSSGIFTLDVTPAEDNNNGICAFVLDPISLAGESISIFTAGSYDDLKMFTVQTDGTLTELPKVAPIMTSAITDLIPNVNYEIFPNPTTDFLNVNWESLKSKANFQVMNGLGQVIYAREENKESGSMSIDFTNFPAGSYWVELKSGNQSATELVVKK